jgi:PadR family transcriptional regulator, regulatory protein PadR
MRWARASAFRKSCEISAANATTVASSRVGGKHRDKQPLTRGALQFIISEDMPRHLLTDFELMLLLGILRVGEEAYGVQIAREVEETTGRRVLLGAAYAALDRLEGNGLVTSRLGEPSPARGGRAKRFFTVSRRGLRAARETQRALISLWRDVPELKERQS